MPLTVGVSTAWKSLWTHFEVPCSYSPVSLLMEGGVKRVRLMKERRVRATKHGPHHHSTSTVPALMLYPSFDLSAANQNAQMTS
jgi:hypothetical protein